MIEDILYRLFYSEDEQKLYFVYDVGEIFAKSWVWSYNKGRSFLSDSEFSSKFQIQTERPNKKLMVLSGSDIDKYAGPVSHDLIQDVFIVI